MKKIISVLLILTLLAVFTLPAAAVAEQGIDDSLVESKDIFGDVGLILSEASCEAGGEIGISVKIGCNPGVCAMVFHVAYDTDALRVGQVVSPYFDASYVLDETGATISLFHLSGDVTTVAPVAEITFLSLGVKGTYPLTLSYTEGNIVNYNEQALNLALVNGKIEVGCQHYYVYDRTVASTCSVKGRVVYICRKCGDTEENELDLLPHTSGEWKNVQAPTCTEPGVYGHYCAVCNQVYESTPISAKGHTFADWMVDVPASCTVAGSKVRICTVCGDEEYGVIPATTHGNSTWKTTDPAGCTVGGTASRVCDDCGMVLETKTIPSTGHLYQWVETTPSTCSVKGVRSELCVICGLVRQTAELPLAEHTAGEWRVKTPATCGVAGVEELHCALCDSVMDNRPITALEHEEDRITVAVAPTANTKGRAEYHCKHCGTVLRTEEIPVTAGRIYGENITTVPGKTIRIPVRVTGNPGFIAGLIEVGYDVHDLLYTGYDLGTVAADKDILVGTPEEGKIRVLIYSGGTNQLNGSTVTANGVIVYLKFTVTTEAKTGTVTITADPNGSFVNNQNPPKLVFFTTNNCTVTIDTLKYGDANGDKVVDTTDLALLKKELAGLVDRKDLADSADCNADGILDTADLSLLKKYLAGLIDKLGPIY